MYKLVRKSDGRGDSGGMSMAIKYETYDGMDACESDSRPLIGYRMRVGSIYARTMQGQDWWQTTPVVTIVSDTPNKVVFKTKSGQEYTWTTDREYNKKNNGKIEICKRGDIKELCSTPHK